METSDRPQIQGIHRNAGVNPLQSNLLAAPITANRVNELGMIGHEGTNVCLLHREIRTTPHPAYDDDFAIMV